MKISFRQADLNDFNDINKLYRNVIKTTFTTWDKNYPSKDMIKDDILTERMLAMVSDDKIIGVAAIDDNKFNDTVKVGGFARICISPKLQGKGLGTKFVKHILEVLKERGCKKVKLRVSMQNIAAIKMYEKCGFANIGTDINFDLEWFLFEKEL